MARVPVPDQGPQGATRVVFVRHALPGETVVIDITEGSAKDRFWRADAVEVLEPSPDRVSPPCPYAGPGRCGGCDFQHVALPRQRALKADVVREQLWRVGRIDLEQLGLDLRVEAVPGDQDGLRWRTRLRLALDDAGHVGMRAHRSHHIVPLDGPEDCRIAAPGARVEVTTGSTDADTVLAEPAGQAGEGPVVEAVAAAGGEHRFAVAADGFWQVHPGAPATLVDAVLQMLAPGPGERALDLYAGVGLFARYLADAVGPDGEVVAVEGDPVAASHAADNLAGQPVRVLAGRVDAVLRAQGDAGDPRGGSRVDVVVLDPPREGARRGVVDLVAARHPRAVAYVACDPAALARDLRTFLDHGYRLSGLRAFDAFPMTHHVEVVALLERA